MHMFLSFSSSFSLLFFLSLSFLFSPKNNNSYQGTPSSATEWAHNNSKFKKLIAHCLIRAPAKRDSAAQLLKLPFAKITSQESAAALAQLSEAVGTIDVSRVEVKAIASKTSSAVKLAVGQNLTGRSIVANPHADWDFGDVEDFESEWISSDLKGIDEAGEDEKKGIEETEEKNKQNDNEELTERQRLESALASEDPDEFGALFNKTEDAE